MKKILLASTALAMLSGIGMASAADLPSRKGPPVAPVYVAPAFTWTGFYVGVNAGYAFGNKDSNNNLPAGAIPVGGFLPTSGGSNGGFIGGGQIGYNYQFGLGQGLVIGVEADAQYVDLGHGDRNFVPYTFATTPGTTFFPGTNGNSNGNFLGTARARVGYAFDRFLIYGTGGLAYGDVGRRNNNGGFAVTAPGFINPFTGLRVPAGATTFLNNGGGSNSRAGYTLGGGVEYAFWNNFTVKAEYLYYNLGHRSNNFAVLPAVFAPVKNRDNDGSIIRVGLNYKFW